MLDMLNEQLGSQHASKLEWIIIWLIVFEVVVLVIWNMLFKGERKTDLERAFHLSGQAHRVLAIADTVSYLAGHFGYAT